ncbi:cell wall hydrolase [Bacillus sp. Marseille-P3661]|uniref:cell wall hydrolase n=1 Tax=Bacillus sp. Marseille-P3661 TaxID=1936234 RepID=UPI000C8278F5|nr:cell wall hydrolase [Bacillus sp. Marseille-P3661]
MKKLMNLLLTITLSVGSYTIFPSTQVNAEKNSLVASQNEKVNPVFPEPKVVEKDNAPTISSEEKKLLARLVHAEAEGEPYAGKVAVATVVLNRVEHKQFPDTIKEVIYEKNAFAPVKNGSINEPADQEALEAVQDALTKQERNKEVVYFYNPETATSDWIFEREVIKKIGNHVFAI